MAWKAKTLAKTLMTVAFVRNLGPLSAMTMTIRFGYAKAHLTVPRNVSILKWYGTSKETISSARRSKLLPDR